MVTDSNRADDDGYPFLDGIEHPKKRAFLVAYCESFNITQSAKLAEVSRLLHYHWLESDAVYARAFEEAKIVGAEALEAECARRAMFGTRKQKFHQGNEIMIGCGQDDPEARCINDDEDKPIYGKPYYEIEFSDTLAIFLLKGAMPEKYRERYEYVDGDEKLQAELDQEIEALAAIKAKEGTGDAPGPEGGENPGKSPPAAS